MAEGQLDDIRLLHVVKLENVGRGRFRGRCSCGEVSDVKTAAGMVWGWETRHQGEQREDRGAT